MVIDVESMNTGVKDKFFLKAATKMGPFRTHFLFYFWYDLLQDHDGFVNIPEGKGIV